MYRPETDEKIINACMKTAVNSVGGAGADLNRGKTPRLIKNENKELKHNNPKTQKVKHNNQRMNQPDNEHKETKNN